METQKVQHELTPEMENKIGVLFKKLIKIYVFAFVGILVLAVISFLLFYAFIVKPNIQRANDAQNKFIQLQEESRRKFEQDQTESEKKFELEQQKAEQKKSQLELEFKNAKDAIIPN